MLVRRITKSSLVISLLLIVIFGLSNTMKSAQAADNELVKTVTVTVSPKGHVEIPPLDRNDFIVSEDGVHQEVLSVSPATGENAPLNLAIVIQEGLPQVNLEIKSLQKFIKGLPAGSQVMVVYLRGNFIDLRQPFTADLNKAASRLRVVSSFSNMPASPFLGLIDVMKRFNGLNQGRNEILFISNGLDPLNGFSGSPSTNLYLEQAIKAAQQENITIFSLFAPSLATHRLFVATYGQSALDYLSEQTGGHAFFMGSGFVTFDAPLAELNRMLNQQYVISYKSTNPGNGFHRVKVSTDYSNLDVKVIKGYKSKS